MPVGPSPPQTWKQPRAMTPFMPLRARSIGAAVVQVRVCGSKTSCTVVICGDKPLPRRPPTTWMRPLIAAPVMWLRWLGRFGSTCQLIGRRVVDGEVASARRASTGDVDLAVVHDGHPAAARRGHRRLLDPCTLRGIQLVDRVHVGPRSISRGLAADQVDLSVDAGRHPVVVGLRERRSELPAVARDVVDLDRTGRLPARRIAAEEVELAVQFGERELGVRFDQVRPDAPIRLRRPAWRRWSPAVGGPFDPRSGLLRMRQCTMRAA